MVGFIAFCFAGFFLFPVLIASSDVLNASMEMTDGFNLVSAGKHFEFGFFTRTNSTYLGIWYCNIRPQTIVWVANRNSPLKNSSGVLKIVKDGNLILQDNRQLILWSTNLTQKSQRPTTLQLLDSGNLVLRHDDSGNSESYLWESFDHPTDTRLPGMRIGKDSRTGLNRYLTSSKSQDDLSTGEFTYRISPYAPPLQFVIWEGNAMRYRTGPWNGTGFSWMPRQNNVFNLKLIVEQEEMYSVYIPGKEHMITRSVLSYSGEVQRYVWNSSSLEWLVMYALPSDPCHQYGHCGVNSICAISEPQICSCLTGYTPKSPKDWEIQIWSGGCIRKHPLNCSKGEDFVELKNVKVPDKWLNSMNTSLTLEECKVECLKNCSCSGYANSNISGKGTGCFLWYGDLIDVSRLLEPSNQYLYLRLSAMDIDVLANSRKKKMVIPVSVAASAALLLTILAFSIVIQMKKAQSRVAGRKVGLRSKGMEDLELPTFGMKIIAEATKNFSESNQIGEGGFGPVYKGQLATGHQIAVKRLSVDSNQGLDEFKNEVILISKLQHRNLIRLLGCCIQGEERLLIYEFMPNRSLNKYIYDDTRKSLTWMRRFHIIMGIARGLLYLHRDSRLRIVHRDLKASNILLDGEMNPKISDFGIARAFVGEQMLARTTRVVGTYGYMAPEYVVNGLYSMKSDVFSFGVLLLEIVSGKRNRDFHHSGHNLNLLGQAWKLWTGGVAFKLIDELMEEPFPISQIERCIQVGLLSVQRCPHDRPTMSNLLSMLDSENSILPQPKQPGFYTEMSGDDTDPAEEKCLASNDITITLVSGR